MQNNNNTTKDLDDFWIELMEKSEWAKNEAYKNPNDFKNLNILGVKKNINTHVVREEKVEQPQVNKIINLKGNKKTVFLYIILIALIIMLIVVAYFIFFNISFSEIKIWLNHVNNFGH